MINSDSFIGILSFSYMHSSYWTCPWNVRCCECERSCIYSQDSWISFSDREHCDDDLHCIFDMLSKEWSDCSVNDASRENRFVRWATFTLVVLATEDASCSIELFHVFNCEVEKSTIIFAVFRNTRSRHDDSVFTFEYDRTICLFCKIGKNSSNGLAAYYHTIFFAMHRYVA